MAATNFTPISLYYSATPSAVPTAPNLVAGELALNTYDGKLYYENSSGVVTLLASATTVTNSFSAGTTGLTPNTATTGAVTLAGTLAVANGGTGITSFGTGVATALGVNTGTAGAFVVNGGALGSPSSVGTMPAFTLGGTVSGGGNQINNVVIGTTTPLAGNFTTLSATKSSTGDVATFVGSGGYTAYINSSGTGVSFGDIASLGANWSGIRTIYQTSVSTYAAGFLVTSTSSTGLAVTGTLSATGTLTGGTSGTAYSFSGSAPATSLALDSSGNLGIGTPSPVYPLDVGATSDVNIAMNNSTSVTSGSRGTLSMYNSAGSTVGFIRFGAVTDNSGTDIQFGVRPAGGSLNSTAMKLDSSGNLGLGVTPSAWSTGSSMDIGAQTSVHYSGSIGTLFSKNVYYNAGYKYKATGTARAYVQDDGGHSWSTAASGTAGNAITFTQAMTLDASGNLGVGTTSPGARIDSKITTPTANATANILQGGDGTKTFNLFQTGSSYNYAGAYVNELWYYCNSSYAGMTFGSDGAVPIKFISNTLERVRIDTSGNLLVGESTATGNPLAGMQVLINSGQTSIVMGHVTGTTSGTQYLGFNFNGSVIGSITQSGTTAVLYNVTSDYRLKTVTSAVTGQGARIDALKPIDYQWKESNEQARGFLAHEFQEVYPSSVSGNKDAIDKDGKPAYQSMQASTSEVIADLVAELQSLRARVAQLESKP